MTEQKKMLKEIKTYVRKRKIPYEYLSKETGYSPQYISNMLGEKSEPSMQFNKLLMMALCSYVASDYKEFKGIIKETQWESILLSLF